MVSKAGELFVCGICGKAFPDEEATMDQQLGPVCPHCYALSKIAEGHLKKLGIDRYVNHDDINPTNKNRLLP